MQILSQLFFHTANNLQPLKWGTMQPATNPSINHHRYPNAPQRIQIAPSNRLYINNKV